MTTVVANADEVTARPERSQRAAWAIWVYALLGLAFVVVYIASYPRTIHERDDVFVSPRENVGYVLTKQAAEGNGFAYPLQHADELPEDISLALTPRDAAFLDGKVVPKDFAGTLLFHLVMFKIWTPLVGLVTPLFAVLAAFVLAKLAEELFDGRVGLLAFILWLTYPAAWVNGSYVFTSDTLALFLTLLTFLFFNRYMRTSSRTDLIWMAGSYGLAVSLRYPSAMVAIPLIVAILVSRRWDLKGLLLAVAAIAPPIVLILLFNSAVYGDALTTGFHLGAELFRNTINYSGESFFKIRPDAVLNHLSYYLISIPNLLLPQVIGLALMVATVMRPAADRVARAALLGASLLIAAYYIPQDAWGSTSPAVNASSLRYILPATALWTIFLAWGAVRVWERLGRAAYARLGIVALIAALLVTNVATMTTGPQGLAVTQKYRTRISFLRRAVERVVEPGGVVMTRYNDKVIWPHRQTLTGTLAVHNEEEVVKPPGETWTPMPSPARFTEIAAAMTERDIPLYVVDLLRPKIERYVIELADEGLTLQRLRTGPGGRRGPIRIYAVLPLEDRTGAGAGQGSG